MATSYAIIAHARGEITVTSERGLGSTFVVRLPLSAGAEVPPEITGATTTPRGDETVIVVEDDPGVRGVAVRTLRKLGYDVLEAADGLMALKQIDVARDRVRLLVTDVVMPHMGGRLVAEAAVAMVPDLRVLYMSGYSDDDVLNSALAGQAISLLQKPFTADALGRKVREVLDRGSTA